MSDTEHLELPRAPLTGSVRYWEWNQPRTAEGVEISGNGVFLRTSHVLSEGAHLTLRLELPAVPGMTVLGKVVRTVRGGVLSAPGTRWSRVLWVASGAATRGFTVGSACTNWSPLPLPSSAHWRRVPMRAN